MSDLSYNLTASGGVTSTARKPNQISIMGAYMAIEQLPPSGADSQCKEIEIWKPVPSEPGLLASSLGRVLLPPRYAPVRNGGYRAYFPKPRVGQRSKSSKTATHELMIIMVRRPEKSAKQAPRKVHQLVCEAFHGPKPFDDAVVIHIDENALNNRPENLKWGTQKENLNMPKHKQYLRTRHLSRDARA